MRVAASVHAFEQADQALAVVGDDVEGGELQAVLDGGGDAGLVGSPWNGMGSPRTTSVTAVAGSGSPATAIRAP